MNEWRPQNLTVNVVLLQFEKLTSYLIEVEKRERQSKVTQQGHFFPNQTHNHRIRCKTTAKDGFSAIFVYRQVCVTGMVWHSIMLCNRLVLGQLVKHRPGLAETDSENSQNMTI